MNIINFAVGEQLEKLAYIQIRDTDTTMVPIESRIEDNFFIFKEAIHSKNITHCVKLEDIVMVGVKNE